MGLKLGLGHYHGVVSLLIVGGHLGMLLASASSPNEAQLRESHRLAQNRLAMGKTASL